MQYADEAHAFRLRRSGARGPRNWDELQMVRAQHRQETVSVAPATEELAGDVPVRIITPADAPCGVLLDIHSGGFYMGAASDNDVRNRALADRLGVAVVSVDYRLAPEHPWPAAPDDCETVAKWLAESAEARFGTGRLVIGGVSAGATLAMTTLLRLRDRGIDAFAGAVLQYGTFDLSAQTPAGRPASMWIFASIRNLRTASRCTPRRWPTPPSTTSTDGSLTASGREPI